MMSIMCENSAVIFFKSLALLPAQFFQGHYRYDYNPKNVRVHSDHQFTKGCV